MKKELIIAFFVLILFPTMVFWETWSGNINLLYGQKELEKDDWEPVEEHSETGLAFDIKEESWPVSLTLEYLSSQDDAEGTLYLSGIGYVDVEVDATTTELAIGLRMIKEVVPGFNFFIGGGLASINAELEATVEGNSVSEDDNTMGTWWGAGLYFTIGKQVNLGAQVRWSKAEVTVLTLTLRQGVNICYFSLDSIGND